MIFILFVDYFAIKNVENLIFFFLVEISDEFNNKIEMAKYESSARDKIRVSFHENLLLNHINVITRASFIYLIFFKVLTLCLNESKRLINRFD